MTKPLLPPSLRTGFTVNRESFQAVLASAFAIQQSQIDRESRSAILEVGRLVTRGELDVDRAMHLIVDRTPKVANSDGAAIDPLLGAQLSLPGIQQGNRPSGDLLCPSARTPSDTELLWADTPLDQAINDIAEQGHSTEASAAAIALKRAEELVRDDSTGMSARPIGELPPRAANAMDIDFAAFPVCIPETTTPQCGLRDPWTRILVILAIALISLFCWMLFRITWLATANPPEPPSPLNSNLDVVPAQPEDASQADPNPLRHESRRHETSSDNLEVYDHGRLVFRLKSPQARGESSANGSTLTFPGEEHARVLQRVEPKYPEAAKQQHLQGVVVLEASVDKNGAIEQLTVISGNSILATAALDAVQKWRFKPLVQNGRAVPFQTRVKANFVLP